VFKVGPKADGTGNELYIKGHIEAESGSIAGWSIGTSSITKGDLGSNGSFHMYTGSYGTGSLFGASGNQSWAMGIGENFGVTSGGTLYAKGLVINNTNFSVTSGGSMTAKDGKIGPWTLNMDGLEYSNWWSDKGLKLTENSVIIHGYQNPGEEYSGKIYLEIYSVKNYGPTILMYSVGPSAEKPVGYTKITPGYVEVWSRNSSNIWTRGYLSPTGYKTNQT
jgi:hypothetical protein